MKRLFKIKYGFSIIIGLIGILTLQNCERDDICAETTATTPRLLIEFYDILGPDDLKNVLRLTAYGEDLLLDENGVLIPPTTNTDSTLVFNENSSAIELPLIVSAEGTSTTVRYVLEKFTNFRLDDDPDTSSNVDILEVSYQTEFVFVSRACGYKSIFNNVTVARVNDDNNWINSINQQTTTIENENSVHVRINH